MQDDDIDGNIYDASHGDALPDSPTPDAGAEAGSTDDRLADQLGELFAVALADEPPSRVTAESVLREVRGKAPAPRPRFAEWLSSAGWKWGGALAGAAALVTAVVVLVPSMGGSAADSAGAAAEMYSSADSATGDGSGNDAGEMVEAPEMAVSAQDRDDSAADAGAADSGSDSTSNSARDDMALSAEAAGESGEQPADQQSESDTGAGGGSDGSAGDVADEPGDSSVGGPPMTAMPDLSAAQWRAATDALPVGAAGARHTLGGNPGGVRGNLIALDDGGSLEVVVQQASGADGFVDVETLRGRGYLVADLESDGVRVTVAASPESQAAIGQADVDRIAQAVLEAS